MYTKQNGVITLESTYPFSENNTVIKNLKFLMNPGAPAVKQSLGKIMARQATAGTFVRFRIYARDMYGNFLNLRGNSSSFVLIFRNRSS